MKISVISCVLLIVFLLYIDTFHTCNARSLTGAIRRENREKMVPLSSKHDYKVSDVKQSVTTKSNIKGPIEDYLVKQTRVDKNDHNSKKSNAKELTSKGAKHSNSKQGDDGSLVSISWRVPQNKRGEKQPGFNLDYSPPREHPGHHN